MRTSKKGFTLAELLIALALLGVIAAFTIPKVIQASGNKEAVAKVREAVATMEQAWYGVKMQNLYVPGQTYYQNIITSLNTLNQGVGAANAGVGAPLANLPSGSPSPHPCIQAGGVNLTGWVQFANGVVITGLTSGPSIPSDLNTQTQNYVLCIDYNGSALPNSPGADIFYGNFNSSGAFNGSGPSANNKNFFWGNTGMAAYNAAGSGFISQGSGNNSIGYAAAGIEMQ